MSRNHDSGNPKWLIILALTLFILESGLVLSRPVTWLLRQVNADDFYYYLVLVRNSAAGLGPTFDGFELTNGFHPLYYFLLLPLAQLPSQTPAFLIKSALVLLLIFHNATGLVLGFGFWRLGQQGLGWLVALIWLLNPWTLAITLHGVEVPIATFLWAVIIFIVLDYRSRQRPLNLKTASILGLFLGLAILARTDSLFLLGAILVTEFFRSWPVSSQPSNQRSKALLTLSTLGGIAFLITLPWWWWNWQNFDMVMQVSGKAVFLGAHGFDWRRPAVVLSQTGAFAFAYLGRILLYNLPAWLLLAFGWWKRRRHAQQSPQLLLGPLLRELDFAWLAAALLALWYIGWLWHVQNWYLLSTIFVVTMTIGLYLARSGQARTQTDIIQNAGLVILVNGLILVGIYTTVGFGFPRLERGYYLAEWLNQHLETRTAGSETRIIGAWNSGVIGYFSQNPVVNLDGVVNNSLYEYKVTHQATSVGQLMDYIRQRQITYITDYEFIYFADPQVMGLREIYESPDYGFRVYQRLESPVE